MLTSSFFNVILTVLLIFTIVLLFYFGRNGNTITVNRTSFVLGTVVHFIAHGKNAEKAIDEAIVRLNEKE